MDPHRRSVTTRAQWKTENGEVVNRVSYAAYFSSESEEDEEEVSEEEEEESEEEEEESEEEEEESEEEEEEVQERQPESKRVSKAPERQPERKRESEAHENQLEIDKESEDQRKQPETKKKQFARKSTASLPPVKRVNSPEMPILTPEVPVPVILEPVLNLPLPSAQRGEGNKREDKQPEGQQKLSEQQPNRENRSNEDREHLTEKRRYEQKRRNKEQHEQQERVPDATNEELLTSKKQKTVIERSGSDTSSESGSDDSVDTVLLGSKRTAGPSTKRMTTLQSLPNVEKRRRFEMKFDNEDEPIIMVPPSGDDAGAGSSRQSRSLHRRRHCCREHRSPHVGRFPPPVVPLKPTPQLDLSKIKDPQTACKFRWFHECIVMLQRLNKKLSLHCDPNECKEKTEPILSVLTQRLDTTVKINESPRREGDNRQPTTVTVEEDPNVTINEEDNDEEAFSGTTDPTFPRIISTWSMAPT